jgi:transcription termination factor NusB
MITYEELNAQNHKITELSNVISILIKDRLICDSETCCKLFYNYIDRVNEHMRDVDTNLYADLLKHSSSDINNIAKNFMSGSSEIKRIMNTYAKKWCSKNHQELSVGKNHEKFLKETDEMFEMVLNRIQDETEYLYPTIRAVKNS